MFTALFVKFCFICNSPKRELTQVSLTGECLNKLVHTYHGTLHNNKMEWAIDMYDAYAGNYTK